jgi:hypothetical protein
MNSKNASHELGVALFVVALLLAGWRDCRGIAHDCAKRWREHGASRTP